MSGVSNLAGVCGWPIHHSLSPLLHNFWLKKAGLSGAYVHFAVRPDEAIRAFQSLKRTSISGVNVTAPLKALAFDAADERTPDATKLGVSNCLYKRDGKLVAHNTDLEGFAVPLINKVGARALSETSAFIIGTGGASRAVIGALLALNVPEIKIAGRTDSKAESLVSMVNVPSFYAVPWEKREDAVGSSALIVNATTGGMTGKPELDLDISQAKPGTLVYDLIYTPRETPLLREARIAGCETLGGLEMLVAQARPSFKLFYGVNPPLEPDPSELLFQALESRQ
jgi:shikimate dehydrogenase